MATYYVYSGASGANNGTSWADAYTALSSAITAASTNGDVIKVHKAHTDILTVNTTYTFAANVAVVCVDKDNADAVSVMDGTTGYIGHTSASQAISLAGSKSVYLYGLAFRIAGGSNVGLSLSSSDGQHLEAESCYFWQGTTHGSAIITTTGGTNVQAFLRLKDCTLRFGATGHKFVCNHTVEMIGGSISSAGSSPTTFVATGTTGSGDVLFNGVDLSIVTGTLIGDSPATAFRAKLINCKLGTGVVILGAQAAANLSAAEAWLYNCAAGDEHYHMAHYNALGETTVSTSLYANDGAEYNTTGSKFAWKIDTTANCSFYVPYISPWIHLHHEGASAITPYLECMRDNSAGAVFQDDEVWAEFSYQGTTGFPLGVFVSDRMVLLGTPANQAASAKTATDWTGETGTPGLFKIGPASSITPAEIGSLSARVCVGEPSITVYVDPQIRT